MMLDSENIPHVGLSESDVVEFKEQWTASALKELCAFANTKGGILYVGVQNDGSIVGTSADDAQQLLIASHCDTKLHITPVIEVERHAGRAVLAITVRPSAHLVRLDGRYYKRVGTASIEMAEDEMASRLVRQADRTWDEFAAPATLEKDIDEAAIRVFVRDAHGREHPRVPLSIQESDPIDVILRNLDLLTASSQPTYAAVLLFGRQPQQWIRSAMIRMAYFRSIDDFTAYPDCTGTLFEQLDRALRHIESANPPTFSFSQDSIQRVERPQYPLVAIREALINALVHRDYMRRGSDIEVKMFPDRLVISNPGGLLRGMTLSELRQTPHRSERRNPLIASTCFLVYLVERYGTGTTRIVSECAKAGLPDPEFAADADTFTVTFWKAPVPLSDRQRQVVAWVKKHERITNAEYQKQFTVSKATATRELEEMVRLKMLNKVGHRGRGVHYVLLGNRVQEPS